MAKILRAHLPILALAVSFSSMGCGPQAKSKSAAEEKVAAENLPSNEEAPEPPLHEAFVGRQKHVKGKELRVAISYYGQFDGKEVLSLALPRDWKRTHRIQRQEKQEEATFVRQSVSMRLDAPNAQVEFVLGNDSDPTPLGRKSSLGAGGPRDTLWLLTTDHDVNKLNPRLFVNFDESDVDSPMVEFPIKMIGKVHSPANDGEATWSRALRRYFLENQESPVARAGASRLRAPGEARDPRPVWLDESGTSETADLMSFVSGFNSVEAALEHRRRLSATARKRKPSIRLSTLPRPSARRHDWGHMLSALVQHREVPELSKSVPAEFYFVHALSGESLFLMLDEIDSFLTPAAHLFERHTSYYGLSERYQTLLGIDRGPLTRVLGSRVIKEMALVGSDPFLRMGSDVSLIFEAHEPDLLAIGLASALGRVSKGHGEVHTSNVRIAGREVNFVRSNDETIHRYYLREGGRFYVSNSEVALERILDTVQGNHPRLSDESDFRYMFSRDEGTGTDVLAYAGDRFIDSIVSARSRILDARRGLARGELRHVSHMALLSAFYGNTLSVDPAELLEDGFLSKHETKHFDGTKIHPGPRSIWGSPGHMRPLIEQKTPAFVTPAEKNAYASFVESYDRAWGETIDPIALRLKLDKEGKGFQAHLRVLPLLNDRQYSQVADFVGSTRLKFRAPALGMQMVLAISEESSLRRELSGFSRSFIGERASFDWLGDYLFVGVEDRNEIVNSYYEKIEAKNADPDSYRLESHWESMPLYAGIAIASRAAADVALMTLKHFANKMADVEYLESVPHAGAQIEAVRFKRSNFRFYYALGEETIFFSFRERTMRTLLDLEKAGKLPLGTKKGRAQFGFETRQRPGGGLSTFLAWLIEEETGGWTSAATRAQILSKVWPLSSEAKPVLSSPRLLAMLGELPVTRDGFFFDLKMSGASAPHRGNELQRIWPALPVTASYLDAVLGELELARFEMAFDPEAPNRQGQQENSLSVYMEIERR